MPESLTIATRRRGLYDITDRVQGVVEKSGVGDGLCVVFVHHTSTSLIVCENADPAVQRDLERFFADLVRDGDPRFEHDTEGPDDMPAHVRSILTQASISIPVVAGRCDLGTWQGIYLWEHRQRAHQRRVSVTVIGEQ